jgi:NADH-quinone oxidoreductase subunit L
VLATETAGWFLRNAWLIPVIPSIAFFVIIFFGKNPTKVGNTTVGKILGGGAYIGLASMFASFVIAAGTTYQWIQRAHHTPEEEFVAPVIRKITWWQSGGVEFGIGQHIDGLAVTMLILVTFISTLVQIFSLEYVRGDRRYTHFFAALTLFSSGMLAMVLAENMVQLILGWEIMGLCSFMLIGHWWEDKANSRAALKAFFTVRTGDIGLLCGTAIVYFGANSWAQENLGESGFSISAINAWALSGTGSHSVLLWGSVALFIACIGKSGQFPLHTWLPDAMAGPTPVSSLLHSSTMVVAGVFLVARLYPVFWEGLSITDTDFNLIAIIGGITIVIAALLAFVQNDIKKVLAYSTVSQLGYMMMGLGVGSWTPAVFHIFTHAFFKCCLFLCAGSISHSGSHHSFDMKKDMGGLRKHMPVTFICWCLSTAALCGIPFFSGFFSKDEIIDGAEHNGYPIFYVVGLVGAFMTAAYMTRATYLTFFGEARGAAAGEHHDEHDAHEVDSTHGAVDAHGAHGAVGADHADDDHGHDTLVHAGAGHGDAHGDEHGGDHGPHESPWLIKGPLIALATLAIFSGYLNNPSGIPKTTHYFEEWVEGRGAEPVTETEFLGVEPVSETELVGAGPGESVSVAGAPSREEEPVEGEGGEEGAAGEGGEEGEEEAHGCGWDVPEEGGVCFSVNHHPTHAKFKWSKALTTSIPLAFGGILVSFFVCQALYTKRNRALVGLTERNGLLRGGYKFLWNKYYLDHLYEKVIVRGIAHPIAAGAYWINQNVLDGIVNSAGKSSRWFGGWMYRNIDQRVVDGAVNGSGAAARGAGGSLRPIQSGKVNQYGALLFSAAAIAALVLVIVNS